MATREHPSPGNVLPPKIGFWANYGPTVFGQGVVLGLGTVTGILSARILGPAGKGEYTAICIWPLWIVVISSLGINQALAFNLGRKRYTSSEMVTAALVVGVLQSMLSILVGIAVIRVVLARSSPSAMHLGYAFVLFTPALFLGTYSANLLQTRRGLWEYNVIRLITPLVYVSGLIILYVAHSNSLRWVVFSQLGGYALSFIVGTVLVLYRLRPRIRWNGSAIPSLVQYGWRTHASNLASLFNQRFDQMILSLLVPRRELGLYTVAVTLSSVVSMFPQAIGIVTFSRGATLGRDEAKRTIGVSIRTSLFWLFTSCVLIYALTPFLIKFFFGAGFEGSIVACRILLPGSVMVGLNQVLYNGANALGHPGTPSIAEGVSLVLTAVGLYILIPRYGYIGAAVVSSASYTLSFLVMLVLARVKLGLHLRELFWESTMS